MSVQVDCDPVFAKLAGIADGSSELSNAERTHVESCLKCQAELVHYRSLLKTLHDLRTQVIQPHPSVLSSILDTLGAHGEQKAIHSMITGRRLAYTSGIAVAAAAGIAGVIFLAGQKKSKTRPTKAHTKVQKVA